MSERHQYSEGICGDGAAILRDGQMVPIEEVVQLDLLDERSAQDKLSQARNLAILEWRSEIASSGVQ